MILFKAEANSKVGGGHLFRCLELARLCKQRGEEVGFIFTESSQNIINRVARLGFKIFNIENEKQYTINAYLRFIQSNYLIVFDTDDYRLYSGKLINDLRSNNIKTACFTITDKFEITTDLLINPNIVSQLHKYKTASYTNKLLGPKYLIFRDDFLQNNPKLNISGKNINMFLYFGNADNNHLTLYFLEILKNFKRLFEKIIVVAGSLNSDIMLIKEIISEFKEVQIELHVDTDNISRLYEECNLAITSGGMSLWEMALFNVSQMVVSSSSREKEYVKFLSALGYILNLGHFNELPSKRQLSKNISEFVVKEKFRILKTEEFKNCINPFGKYKIVNSFLHLLH